MVSQALPASAWGPVPRSCTRTGTLNGCTSHDITHVAPMHVTPAVAGGCCQWQQYVPGRQPELLPICACQQHILLPDECMSASVDNHSQRTSCIWACITASCCLGAAWVGCCVRRVLTSKTQQMQGGCVSQQHRDI